AYRIGTDGDLFRVGDDGEPSGSAGRPILGQIDSRGITNTGVVVVRYFGGTLLGVPGLINAYKTATALALQVIPVEEKVVELKLKITCTYQDINDVIRIVKLCNGTVLTNDQALFCTLFVSIPKNRVEQAEEQLSKLYQVEYQRA
ncbi:MAG TPA: YigZ family protein, partial [Phnomibacter sp.]|nr:YigZ family protein [Phnomibacter sp.]